MLLAAPELPIAAPAVDLFIALATPDAARSAFNLAREARRVGLGAQLELTGRSLKGQLKHADRIGARYVAIVGSEPEVALKHMESGEQTAHEPKAVIATILRGHSDL
jgi:histidyl-tRNA synthetase